MINLAYGVSPQPAHAPENSNNGCLNCEPLTVFSAGIKSSLYPTFSGAFFLSSSFNKNGLITACGHT